jgi:HEPN domain-containing protein
MNSASVEKNLALEDEKVAVWKVSPFQLVSLLDMKRYHLTHIQNLALIEVGLMHDITDLLTFPKGAITPEHIGKFKEELNKHEVHLRYLRLKHSRKYLKSILEKLSRDGYTYEEYEQDVKVLQQWEDSELDDVVFGFIPADHAPYFENNELFGKEVNDSFPSSAKDIEEAGSCYSHGHYTACVFHLMRALEHPLRALAKDLRVPPPARNPQTPLELRTWGDVINAITNAINARPNPRTRAQAERAEFYNKAADQFQFFKDAWRDVVMHTRSKPYGEGEAKDLIKSVETFMQRLALRLKEKKRAK